VYVEPSGDLRVVLRGPGEVLLFGDPPYRERLVTFLSLRRDLAEKAPGAEQFDLRFRGRIFAKQPAVQPRPGAAASLPTAEKAVPRAAGSARPAPPLAADPAAASGLGPQENSSTKPQAVRGAGLTPEPRAGWPRTAEAGRDKLGSATPWPSGQDKQRPPEQR